MIELRVNCHEQVVEALREMIAEFDTIDNGYCTTCRQEGTLGHRLWDSPGHPGTCSNPHCSSHRWRAALDAAKER